MKLSSIARSIGAHFSEQYDRDILGISSPENAGEEFITFLSNPKYLKAIEASLACAVIVRKGTCVAGKICLEVDDPYVGYARTAQLFEDVTPMFGDSIHSSAVIDPSANIDPSASIGPLTVISAGVSIGAFTRVGASCVIEKNSSVGEHCRIDSNVTIRWGTEIKNRVVIQSGAIIGSDGFGNAREKGKFIRIPAFGTVVIGNDVEVGACTTIDRGNFDPTVIGDGVKLDNLNHIAHNVIIGDDTAMAAQSGISGSTKLGKRVIVGGQAGFVGHIEIGDDAFIGAKAGVSKDVDPGAKITGYPARDFMTMRRIEASQSSLPSLLKEIKQLREDIQKLKDYKS